MHKKFSLERALCGDPIQTVDGIKMELVKVIAKSAAPVICVDVETGQERPPYRANGKTPHAVNGSSWDLVMAPGNKIGYVNITSMHPVYATRKDALFCKVMGELPILTLKVEYED